MAEGVDAGQCPLLEELRLGYNYVGPLGLRALAAALQSRNLSRLTHLELSGNNLLGGGDGLAVEGMEGEDDDGAVGSFAGALEVIDWFDVQRCLSVCLSVCGVVLCGREGGLACACMYVRGRARASISVNGLSSSALFSHSHPPTNTHTHTRPTPARKWRCWSWTTRT